MIRDTIEIQCDRCGRHEQIQRMIAYRISSLMASFIQELETAGWMFERDSEYSLKRVYCPFCVKGIEEVMRLKNLPHPVIDPKEITA